MVKEILRSDTAKQMGGFVAKAAMGALLAENESKEKQMTDYWDVATTRNHLICVQRALAGSLPDNEQSQVFLRSISEALICLSLQKSNTIPGDALRKCFAISSVATQPQ